MNTKNENTGKHPAEAGKTEELKITGNWDTQAKLLKEKFPQLTDTDLRFVNGKENELVTRIGARLNKKPNEVVNIIKKGQPAKA